MKNVILNIFHDEEALEHESHHIGKVLDNVLSDLDLMKPALVIKELCISSQSGS